MAKTAPIVIPLTVDTTGVDRGLSNVRSRLGRGGGRGTGSGFGTGGNNANGVGKGGGTDGGSGLLGGILGGGIVGRILQNQTRKSGLDRALANTQNEFERRVVRMQFKAGVRTRISREAVNRYVERSNDVERVRDQVTLGNLPAEALEQERQANQRRRRKAFELMERESVLTRAVRRGMFKRAFGSSKGVQEGVKYGLGRLGVPEFIAGRVAGVAGSGLGLALGGAALGVGAVVGTGALAANFRQRQAQMFSNFSQYEGTPFYGIARAQARRFGKEDQISWWDRMWLREAESGGALSKTLNFIGYLFGKGAEGFGYMVGQSDPFQMQSSSRTLANVLYGRTVRAAN